MPTAVMIESSENTMSSSMICTITPPKVAVAAAAPPVLTCSMAPSSFWWISWVALPIRNRPPPIRIRSRQENAWPNSSNSGAVSPTIQAIASNRPSRDTAASMMPRRRALSRRSGGSLPARIEMKMMLSMPSTSSSAVSVARAIQISGLASCSMGGLYRRGAGRKASWPAETAKARKRASRWVLDAKGRVDAPVRLWGHGGKASLQDAPSPWDGEGLARKWLCHLLLHRGARPVMTATAIGSYSPSAVDASTAPARDHAGRPASAGRMRQRKVDRCHHRRHLGVVALRGRGARAVGVDLGGGLERRGGDAGAQAEPAVVVFDHAMRHHRRADDGAVGVGRRDMGDLGHRGNDSLLERGLRLRAVGAQVEAIGNRAGFERLAVAGRQGRAELGLVAVGSFVQIDVHQHALAQRRQIGRAHV